MKLAMVTLLLYALAGCGQELFNPDKNDLRESRLTANEEGSDIEADLVVDTSIDAKPKSEEESEEAGNQNQVKPDYGAIGPNPYGIPEWCPIDAKIIEQLIASGQPFEVECEAEIQVGPDLDD